MGFPDSPSGGVLRGFYGGAVGLGGGELQLALKALFQPLAGLRHVVEALGDGRVEVFGLVPVEAGALQVLDLAAQRANIIDQNQKRIGAAALASPAPALCALASRSASSPAISFWSTSRVAFLRRVDASHLEILGSFRASVVTMAPTMIFRRVSLAF